MKRLEIIHLRLAGNYPADLTARIHRSAAARQSAIDIEIYRQEGVIDDLSVHLRHRDNDEVLPSALGLSLAAALKEYGMVDHSIWRGAPTG